MIRQARPKLRPELSVVLKETRGVSSSGVTRASVAREVREIWITTHLRAGSSFVLICCAYIRIQVEMLKAARGCAFISQFYAAFIAGDKHYMVMEYVTGGDLLKTVQQCIAVKVMNDACPGPVPLLHTATRT